ncbi:MAG TPA: ABC transporter ATP-binding protein [Vicinamibacterales bacterium]|nr:ABC transporter ATP-binding protein [Vicinamibacterales bacterium]
MILHSAGLTTEGRAIAIAGPKGAGKTTLLLQLLASGRARYLCNDRLAVDPISGRARAVPTIVAIRDGTRQLAPGLAAALNRAGDFRLNDRERAAMTSPPASRAGVWHFSPAQVAAATSCKMDVEAPLSAVVVITGTGERTAPTPIPASDAARVLAEHTIGARSSCYTSEVFSPPATPVGAERIRARCEQLAHRVRMFAIHAGEPLRAGEAAALIDAIVS